MSIYDASFGKFKLSLTADETKDLESKSGFEEDGNVPMATYKALLKFNTASDGLVYATIPSVFVNDFGVSC